MTEQPRGSGFSTLAIHAGAEPKSTAGPCERASLLTFDHASPAPLYAADPTCAVLEERLATLEGGSAALALGSGKAATLVALLPILRPGDALIVSRRLSSRFGDPFDHAFKSFGWQVVWADPEKPESFVEALGDRTKALLIDSISGSGEVANIDAIARVARRARVPLLVDNTFATPFLVRPFEHGADIVIHVTTRLLAGHAGSTGGAIVDGGTFDWAGEDRYPSLSKPLPGHGDVSLADSYGNFAFAVACRMSGLREFGLAATAPEAALVLNGIETLALRMQRHCDNALAVAQHLSRHHAVRWVRYPGLDGDPGHELARHSYPRGTGAAVAFGLAGGQDAGAALAQRLALFSPLVGIGDTRSRISHPASSPREPAETDPGLVRLAIGLEDVADIIADLDQALAI